MKFLWTVFLFSFFALNAYEERFYFNFDEMDRNDSVFHIHVGENRWIQTKAVQADTTGLFTYVSNIYTEPGSLEYKKQWRCPYCNMYWPEGTACQNAKCPSRY